MKKLIYISIILILTYSCKIKTSEEIEINDSYKNDIPLQTETIVFSEYKSDSLTIDLINNDFNYTVLVQIDGSKKEYDLNQLNIPTKTPELLWVNQAFACMVTWWSQAQSRHVFIPTKKEYELIYFNKVIAKSDSINNNVVYIDSVFEKQNKVVFKVENLLTRKSKSLEFKINEKNGVYPYYEEIILTKNHLTISSAIEDKSIDIKEINNRL